MKRNQNSQLNPVNDVPNMSEGNYSYVFATSQGENAPSQKVKANTKKRRIALILALCIVVSFLSGMGGAFLLGPFENGVGSDTGVQSAPDPSKVFHSNPQSLLAKNEGEASDYGSAGKAVFAPGMVAHVVRDSIVVINVRYRSYMGYSQGHSGSGVIVSKNGYILTCNHVIEDAQSIEVVLNSGATHGATLVGSDEERDLAVIKIDPGKKALPYAKHGCSKNLVVGERVVAVGNPLGLELTSDVGKVLEPEGEVILHDGSRMRLIQTDVSLEPENSGCGLFNLDGELIGIVNARYSVDGAEDATFALPIDSVYEVETQLIKYGYVRGIADHGLKLLEVGAGNLYEAYNQYGIEEEGLYVYSSEYTEEIKALDRIVTVNGCRISSKKELKALIATYKVDDVVTVVVARGDQRVTVLLRLKEFVPNRLKNNAKK